MHSTSDLLPECSSYISRVRIGGTSSRYSTNAAVDYDTKRISEMPVIFDWCDGPFLQYKFGECTRTSVGKKHKEKP